MKYFISLRNCLQSTLLVAIAVMFVACGGEDQSDEEPGEGRTLDFTDSVTFLDENDEEVVSIDVAVSDDSTARNEGLMDVRELPENSGMLFIFEDEEPRSFWMANTPLSLDIFYLNNDQEIIRIHQNTQPYSENNFTSELPARYVIETNAGFAVRYDIKEGMKADF
jgi:uncharacterized protein